MTLRRLTKAVLRDRRKTEALELIAERTIEPERIAATVEALERIALALEKLAACVETVRVSGVECEALNIWDNSRPQPGGGER